MQIQIQIQIGMIWPLASVMCWLVMTKSKGAPPTSPLESFLLSLYLPVFVCVFVYDDDDDHDDRDDYDDHDDHDDHVD